MDGGSGASEGAGGPGVPGVGFRVPQHAVNGVTRTVAGYDPGAPERVGAVTVEILEDGTMRDMDWTDLHLYDIDMPGMDSGLVGGRSIVSSTPRGPAAHLYGWVDEANEFVALLDGVIGLHRDRAARLEHARLVDAAEARISRDRARNEVLHIWEARNPGGKCPPPTGRIPVSEPPHFTLRAATYPDGRRVPLHPEAGPKPPPATPAEAILAEVDRWKRAYRDA